MKRDDIPTNLPPHPQEARLRQGEMQLAANIRKTADEAVRALKKHRRHDAAVALAQLAQVAAAGQKAQVRAIQDQMDLLAPTPGPETIHDPETGQDIEVASFGDDPEGQ